MLREMKGSRGAGVENLAAPGSSTSSPAICLSGKAPDCHLFEKKDIACIGIISCLFSGIVMYCLKYTLYYYTYINIYYLKYISQCAYILIHFIHCRYMLYIYIFVYYLYFTMHYIYIDIFYI